VRLFAAIAIVLIFMGATVRADDAADLKDTWTPLEGTNAGVPLGKALIDAITLVITDGKYQVKVMGNDENGTLKFDAAKTPKTMDISATDGPNKGKTILAIYELTGDTLKVCYDIKGAGRPTKFESTKENEFLIFVYKRKK
jgi:uncharacterized protein (TIGR03067 family)